MTPERWGRIEQLYHLALERVPGERPAFLDKACAGDETLRAEVESLLDLDEGSDRFLETPPGDVVAAMLVEKEAQPTVGEVISPVGAGARAVASQPSGSSQAPEDAPSVRDEIRPGATLKGRYVIDREIGRGGVGVVYLARDRQLHSKPVVVKVLLDESGSSEWFKKKFLQEVEALARLDHPGIVAVTDAGTTDDGKQFLVMQFVDGVSLRSQIHSGGMDFQRVARIIRQAAQALDAAHDKGILHCDLKPENIMLQTIGEDEEMVKIIDFGIAKVRDSQVDWKSATRTAGTIAYMAPEQLLGSPGVASDVFALGVIAYEMLTGHLPITQFETLDSERAGVKVKPKELRADLPDAAEAVILKALSFRPEDRHARARDFGDELARALTADSPSPKSTNRIDQDAVTKEMVSPETGVNPGAATAQPGIEMAHVLFMDLVGYSKMPMDEQAEHLKTLQEIVRNTPEFQRAETSDQLLRLATGDGMALVFFRDPIAPVRCAQEISRQLRGHAEISLRMGLHTGPVYHVADINTNRNIVGGGINVAQRVMDCGDAGHILVSKSVADVLSQIRGWSESLHDLGSCEVKHGVRVHLFNLYGEDFGRQDLPERFASIKKDDVHEPQEKPEPHGGNPEPRPKRVAVRAVIAVLVLGLGVVAYRRCTPPPTHTEPPPRTLFYSVKVLNSNGERDFASAEECILESRDQFRLKVSSPESSYVYIINQQPSGSLVVLLPRPNSDTALLPSNHTLSVPEGTAAFGFTNGVPGVEKIWLVSSKDPIPELNGSRGQIREPERIRTVQDFLARHADPGPAVAKDAVRNQTAITGREVFVHVARLEHR